MSSSSDSSASSSSSAAPKKGKEVGNAKGRQGKGSHSWASSDWSDQPGHVPKDMKAPVSKGVEGLGKGGRPDPDFPHTLASLVGNGGKAAEKRFKDYVWRRPENFNHKKSVLFNTIDPNDIEQGFLGDCYFLSALSVLAEDPKNIKRLFKTTKYDAKKGLFTVYLYKNGTQMEVTVDDYFPCASETEGPAFSHSSQGELWVLVLEKAYAKVHGSYFAIEGGRTAEAFEDLTGAPTTTIELNQFRGDGQAGADMRTNFHNSLAKWDHEAFVMSAAIGKANEAALKELGLVGGHSYGLLDVRVIEGNPIVKLRNPWGDFEWKGAWNDSDPRWTPKYKKKVNMTNKDDGEFWMAMEDFVTYFDNFTVLFLQKKWVMASVATPLREGRAHAYLKVDRKTHLYMRLMQDDKKMRPWQPDYKYCALRFSMLDSKGELVAKSSYTVSRSVFCDFYLEKGEHFVTIVTDTTDSYPSKAELEKARKDWADGAAARAKKAGKAKAKDSSTEESSADASSAGSSSDSEQEEWLSVSSDDEDYDEVEVELDEQQEDAFPEPRGIRLSTLSDSKVTLRHVDEEEFALHLEERLLKTTKQSKAVTKPFEKELPGITLQTYEDRDNGIIGLYWSNADKDHTIHGKIRFELNNMAIANKEVEGLVQPLQLAEGTPANEKRGANHKFVLLRCAKPGRYEYAFSYKAVKAYTREEFANRKDTEESSEAPAAKSSDASGGSSSTEESSS